MSEFLRVVRDDGHGAGGNLSGSPEADTTPALRVEQLEPAQSGGAAEVVAVDADPRTETRTDEGEQEQEALEEGNDSGDNDSHGGGPGGGSRPQSPASSVIEHGDSPTNEAVGTGVGDDLATLYGYAAAASAAPATDLDVTDVTDVNTEAAAAAVETAGTSLLPPTASGEMEVDVLHAHAAGAVAADATEPATSALNMSSDSDDFKSPGIPRKRPAEAMQPDSDDEDSYTCPVCFEPWSTSGRHRVVSLKCGHLFGKQCIEKWLKGQGDRCPQCNLKASKKDIRPLFVKVLKAVDTSGEESLRRELEAANQEKRRAERAEASARIQFQILKATHEKFKAEVLMRPPGGAYGGAATDDGAGPAEVGPSDHDPRFVLETTVQLKQTDCRVLEYDERHAMLLCSGEGLANPFGRGAACGLVKVSALDPTRTEYIPIHHKAIRDIRSCPDNSGTILTASLDRTAKLTNINSNTVVCSYKLDAPSWTCCWDKDRPTTFYVGLTTSHIVEFDTRDTATPVRTYRSPVPKPLVALHHMSAVDGFELRGLLACTLGGTSFWDYSNAQEPTHHAIPALDGAATWTAPHPESQHCITTLRPGRDRSRVQHIVSKLSPDAAEGVSCAIQGVMVGGMIQKSLSRSTLLSKPGSPETLFMAASDEPTHTVKIWDVASGGMLQSLTCQGLVCTDVKAFRAGNAQVLAVLTERRLLLHTWR
eukprot:m.147182 g.147182  ORF g.147182 m.147182 type:complete len:706 (+) comp23133_c0_seq1:113-2230(+)